MRTIIAGSRDSAVPDDISVETIEWAVRRSGFIITEVVWGKARGIDTKAKLFADKHGIPDKAFPADWDKFGNAAGHIRNAEMGNYGEQLILLWDGESKGSKGMMDIALKKGMPVFIHYLWR